MFKCFWVLIFLTSLIAAAPVAAQDPQGFGPATKVCGSEVPPPVAQPPANSGPVVYLLVPCFEAQGNITLVDAETYLLHARAD